MLRGVFATPENVPLASASPQVPMIHYKSTPIAVSLAALLTVGSATARAQEPVSSHARQAATTSAPQATNGAVHQVAPPHDDITRVRRQPRDLLQGIVLTRAEKKAVNGIIRRNARTLKSLEASSAASGQPDAHARLEREVAALRDRERAELRAVLDEKQRIRFDANVAKLAERER